MILLVESRKFFAVVLSSLKTPAHPSCQEKKWVLSLRYLLWRAMMYVSGCYTTTSKTIMIIISSANCANVRVGGGKISCSPGCGFLIMDKRDGKPVRILNLNSDHLRRWEPSPTSCWSIRIWPLWRIPISLRYLTSHLTSF